MDRNKLRFPIHRLQALDSRYRHTLRKMREEMKRPLPDMFTLQKLKRRRVLLKDEITKLLRPFSNRDLNYA